ncbi:MAG: hypothetical protein ACOCWH_00020 [Spirochaetota bacterium]
MRFMYTRVVIPALLLCLLFGCDSTSSGGSGGGNGSSSSVVDEAVSLPDFPDDARVAEMDSIDINGTEVGNTDGAELPDTDSDSVYVSVTIPSSLSRADTSGVQSVNVWANDTVTELEFNEADGGVISGALIDLKDGANYFCFVIETRSGNRYRSIVMKITRVANDGNTLNDTVVGNWRTIQVVETTYNEETGQNETTTTFISTNEATDGGEFRMELYLEFTETTMRTYVYTMFAYDNNGETVMDESFTYCGDDDLAYHVEGTTLSAEGEVTGLDIRVYGEVMTYGLSDGSFYYVLQRDDDVDFSEAWSDCSKR